MYAKITKDLLYDGDAVTENRTDVSLWDNEPNGPILKIRLLDDDREVYYHVDADDEVLEDLAAWAMRDSGVTILQVKDDAGDWKDTIG